jgi:GH24 family phage-related lysozyme (muramidase)
MAENAGLMQQDVLHEDDAVAHAESLLKAPDEYSDTPRLTPIEEHIVRQEGFRFTPVKEHTGVWVSGFGQTGSFRDMPLRKVVQIKENEARALFTDYDTFNPDLQKAIMSGVYRGDFKKEHTTVDLINKGDWKEAGRQFLRNKADDDKSKSYREALANPTKLGGVVRQTKNFMMIWVHRWNSLVL